MAALRFIEVTVHSCGYHPTILCTWEDIAAEAMLYVNDSKVRKYVHVYGYLHQLK